MNISPELQSKLDMLESNLIVMVRNGNKSALKSISIIDEIKRRNHAMLSSDGLRRINNLVDIMIEETQAVIG